MDGPVICGVDGSSSAKAIRVARELAERFALPLLYVHVASDAYGREEEAAAAALRAAGTRRGKLLVEDGHPADRLVTLAAERRASFLVVGNHGPRASTLGSISADVSRRAPCPVVVVPTTVRSPEEAGDELRLAGRAPGRPRVGA